MRKSKRAAELEKAMAPPETDEDDELDAELAASKFMDWDPPETVAKIIKSLKSYTIHEALLILVSAAAELMRAAPGDWDNTKVKSIIESI